MGQRSWPAGWSVLLRLSGLLARKVVFLAAVCLGLIALIFLRAGIEHQGSHVGFAWPLYRAALGRYLQSLLRGDPGVSEYLSGRTTVSVEVVQVLRLYLPTSLTLIGLALAAALVLGLGFGLLISRFGRRGTQHLTLLSNVTALSLPDVVLVLLTQVAVFRLQQWLGVRLIPIFGPWSGEMQWAHFILPTFVLCVLPTAYLARVAAAAFDEVGREEFVRTAVAKGLTRRQVLRRHVAPLVTVRVLPVLPAAMGLILSSLVLVEYLAVVPGIGRSLAIELMRRTADPILLTGLTLPLAVGWVLFDTLVQALILVLDPRQRDQHDKAGLSLGRRLAALAPGALVRRLAAGFTAAALALGEAVVSLVTAAADGIRARLTPSSDTQTPAPPARRPNGLLVVGTALVVALVAVAIFADALAPYDPRERHGLVIDGEVIRRPPHPPGPDFLLGTDTNGYDLLSGVIHGTRYTLLLAAVIVPARFLLAVPLGMVAGWQRGALAALTKGMAAVFGAVPLVIIPGALLPLLVAETRFFGDAQQGALTVSLVILALVGWPRLAETVRRYTEEVAVHPFIEGARATGAGAGRLLARHVLPHLWPRLVVLAAMEVCWVMALTAQLGMLKIYVGGHVRWEDRSPTPALPDWGSMLETPWRHAYVDQWVLIVPVAAIFCGLLAFNLLAEGLRRRAESSDFMTMRDSKGQ